jgi:Uma2 family endonuclease
LRSNVVERAMMSALPKNFMTPEEYLKFDRESDIFYEYLNGEVVAMTDPGRKYNLILGSVFDRLYTQLRGRPCKTWIADQRVKVTLGVYTYPGICVASGEREFEDDEQDTLLNPTVIMEVLSPSTENYNRARKSPLYRKLKSLQEYALVEQDSVWIEHYARRGEQWILTDFSSRDDVISLRSIDCALALRDVYEKVTFEVDE